MKTADGRQVTEAAECRRHHQGPGLTRGVSGLLENVSTAPRLAAKKFWALM
ncbi:hypothetical protein ACWERY_19450 [Streptomyces sp. NPDC004082]|uniref:hypothetical protein n=1 Tax=unclassified Streptomyces TaxID=2593676 RepID=UPI0033ABAED2